MAKFLVVDDSPTSRDVLKRHLRTLTEDGAEVSEAPNASTAITLFRETKPDAIFLDMMMAPGPQGIDIIRSMLRESPTSRIVLVTALEREHPDVVASMSLGAFGYLRKPVRLRDVKLILSDFESESGRVFRIG